MVFLISLCFKVDFLVLKIFWRCSLPELFERSCEIYRDEPLLGTRKLIAKETEVTRDGNPFEKLHLGEYEWLTYGKTFESICSFASGLAQLGHSRNERAAIFADTQEEWYIAMQRSSGGPGASKGRSQGVLFERGVHLGGDQGWLGILTGG